MIASGIYTPNVLPIFLTDNVFESFDGTAGPGSGCCTLGYHNSEGPPAATAHTWIYAAYTKSGTFRGDAILDVQSLSHEVNEWINDPFVGAFALGFINLIPPTILPGQGGACIPNFETADPLEAPPSVFTQVTNGTAYHVQEVSVHLLVHAFQFRREWHVFVFGDIHNAGHPLQSRLKSHPCTRPQSPKEMSSVRATNTNSPSSGICFRQTTASSSGTKSSFGGFRATMTPSMPR